MKNKKRIVGKKAINAHLAKLTGYTFLVIAGLAITSNTLQALSLNNKSSGLIQRVLGDEETKEEESREEEKKQEEQAREESKKNEEQKREADNRVEETRRSETKSKSNTESGARQRTVSPTPKPRTKDQVKMELQTENGKSELEIETEDGVKFKTKVEDDGEVRIESEQEGMKAKYRFVNGQLIRQESEDADGEREDTIEDEQEDVDEEELEDEVEISSDSGKQRLTKGGVAARSNFPLTVNSVTRELVVNTPAGEKVVTILPDEAVQNLIDAGVFDQIALTDNTLNEVELSVLSDQPVYEIDGTKEYRIFSIFPVTRNVKSVVSAETGDLITTEKSFLTNIIDLLSP